MDQMTHGLINVTACALICWAVVAGRPDLATAFVIGLSCASVIGARAGRWT